MKRLIFAVVLTLLLAGAAFATCNYADYNRCVADRCYSQPGGSDARFNCIKRCKRLWLNGCR